MSEFIGAKVEGAQRLRTTMRKAGVDMKNLAALNRAAANIVLPVAKALAPVGSPVNGHISSTIRTGATQKAGIIRAGGSSMPYAGLIHFGAPSGYTDSLGRTRAIQGQPWIAMAAKQTEPVWVENYFEGLMKVIDSIEGE